MVMKNMIDKLTISGLSQNKLDYFDIVPLVFRLF